MNLKLALVVYIAVLFLATFIFNHVWNKPILDSLIVGLILAQISLMILATGGVFDTDDNDTGAHSLNYAEILFWSITILTPFIVYFYVVYHVYNMKGCYDISRPKKSKK